MNSEYYYYAEELSNYIVFKRRKRSDLLFASSLYRLLRNPRYNKLGVPSDIRAYLKIFWISSKSME